MPRVCNIGSNINQYCEQTGNGSSTWDLCMDCANILRDNQHIFDKQLKPYNAREPEGNEGRGEEGIEHPCYSECDYECAICKTDLTEDDN